MPPTHDKTGRTRTRSGDIMVAPLTGAMGPYRRNKIAGQFVARLIEMLESPAYRVMSLSAHRLLDRLEVELAHHGGHDNGKLPVTYSDFVKYGIERHSIAPAMREVEALGFAEVTERGRAGNAVYRTPNKFRLTYRPTASAATTDEWKKINCVEDAKLIAQVARTPIKRGRLGKRLDQKQKPVRENPRLSVGNPHPKP